MSITATLLLSALATKTALPSGETAILSGVLPSGALGKTVQFELLVETIPRVASITDTQLLEAQATKMRSSRG